MITVQSRRLDRVTLVRRYISIKAWEEFCGAIAVANMCACNKDLKKIKEEYSTSFTKSCSGKVSKTNFSFRFFSVQNKPAISISCTPSKFADDDWAEFLAQLTIMFPFGPQQVWGGFRLAKLEIAMDVKVPLDDMVCVVPKVTAVDSSYLHEGTLYLGQRYGYRSYCVYDKRKQLVDDSGVELGHNVTRIEVRLRSTGKTLGQLGEFGPPFGNLLVLRKSALSKLLDKHPHSNDLKAFVEAVLDGAIAQQVYLDLSPYARKTLLKLLRPVALKLNSEAKNWSKWFAEQQITLESRFLGAS